MQPAKSRIIDFGDGSVPIKVDYSDSPLYRKCKNYHSRILGTSWHEFTIHHNGQLDYHNDPKQLILDGLFDAVDGEEFYPVAYQQGNFADRFLARSCKPALDNLFKLGLFITLPTGAELPISVQLNVAPYKTHQISPTMIISQVLSGLMDSLEQYNGTSCILNLRNFGGHRCFKNVVISLSNLATLKQICTNIYHNDERFRFVKGIVLSGNKIRSLAPLEQFAGMSYELLDLSDNRLSSASRLCRELASIKATELMLADNPITKSKKFPDCLKPLENNFKLIDGVEFNRLYSTYTPLNNNKSVESAGMRIDWTNKTKLQHFQNSTDWHAFVIPEAEFSKEVLFDYFFISVDEKLTEFYPCYYKKMNGEHRFLVRNCFDQIEHLVNNCNLELRIPRLVSTEISDTPQVKFERSIPYYLLMNYAPFKQGEVEPKPQIELAVQKCFRALNRLLNLNKFDQTEGLENIVVSMSSPKIIMNIVTIVSRKYLGNCKELRLSNNKIMSLNQSRNLSLLATLQALDLSHNWIHTLEDIKALHGLPLKSLILHGNPVCRKYSMPSEYIKAVREYFPLLTKLDGVDLSTQPGQATQKNFLVNIAAYELVGELFLATYLREFENVEDRTDLLRFYTDTSLFTMTCSFNMAQDARYMFKRIAKYSTHSRNLYKMTEYSRAANSIHYGANEIIGVMMQLPNVKHDFVSLQTDVMHYDGQSAVINVTGLLCELATSNDHALNIAFSRQFILKLDAEGLGFGGGARRFKITNERFNIMNPTPKQITNAFRFENAINTPLVEPEPEDSVDVKEQKLLIFQEITGLRPVWCTRCLEDAGWDYQRALELFLQLNENGELPDNAFL